MKVKLTFGRVQFAALFGAVLAIATGLGLHFFRLGNGLANSSYDLLLVARGDMAISNAVIVYLDDDSYQTLLQPQNAPWDRSLHAKLVDRLSAAGAKAVVFDIAFSDPSAGNLVADQQFADAIRRNGHVVLAADTVPDDSGKHTIPPIDLLLDQAAGFGSDEVMPDADHIIRRHTSRHEMPASSLTWALAESLGVPLTKQPSAEDRERWMNYYGRPGLLPSCSYAQALDGTLPGEFFRGNVVFVGGRIITKQAGELQDQYSSPFSEWLHDKVFMPGVEIQATAFLNLLRGDWLERLSPLTEQLILAVIGVIFGVTLVLYRPVVATIVAMAGFAAVAGGSYLLLKYHFIWFPFLIAGVQIGVALGWSVLFNSVQLYVEKRLYEHTLSLYLSPKLVKKFSGNPQLLKPGAEKQTLTLFFSDIADFTTLSEGMDSDDLARLMNAYFETAVSKCIHRTDGTVVKYIGDAIFAFWSAPDRQVDHAIRACQAALYFQELDAQKVNGKALRTRIGLHTGLVNVGNFGSVERVDYTALGENVNLASRLEGLNKYLGTTCLMSGETQQGTDGQCVTRLVGRFRLKGFERAVEAHELIGWPQNADTSRDWREAFAAGLKNYQQGQFAAADADFERALQLRPGDGPSEYYRALISRLAASELPPGWTGEIELKDK